MYKIEFDYSYEKMIKGIPEKYQQKIRGKILSLASNPKPKGYKKLTSINALRIRIGIYRVIDRKSVV